MWNKTSQGKPSSPAPQAPPAGLPTSTTPKSVPESVAASTPVASVTQPAPAPAKVTGDHSPNASRIGSGLKIHGEISGNSDLYIDGEMQGKIRLSNAHVAVGPNGRIQADIDAKGIVIDGSVHGNLKASDNVHLGPTGRLQGSVITPRIGIDDGARLRGKVEMVRASSASESSSASQSYSTADPTSSTAENLRPVGAGAKDE